MATSVTPGSTANIGLHDALADQRTGWAQCLFFDPDFFTTGQGNDIKEIGDMRSNDDIGHMLAANFIW